jgi:hypothetical protein
MTAIPYIISYLQCPGVEASSVKGRMNSDAITGFSAFVHPGINLLPDFSYFTTTE